MFSSCSPSIYEIEAKPPKFCEENIIMKTTTHMTILTACHCKEWGK